MDIKNYITFNRVFEKNSFSQTAELLNYAQSTVSLHIKELERHYDETLFDRIGKRIYPTAFGLQLYEKSMELERQYLEVTNIKKNEQPTQIIRIGVYESLLMYRLSEFMLAFRAKFPDVNIVMKHGVCSENRQLLIDGELDISFQIDQYRDYKYLITNNLCLEPMSIIVPKGRGMDCLQDENLTLYLTEYGCRYRSIFENFLSKNCAVNQFNLVTGSVDLIKRYVSLGLGYGMVPTIAVTSDAHPRSYDVIDFALDQPLYTQIIYHKDKVLAPSLKAFIDLVKQSATRW